MTAQPTVDHRRSAQWAGAAAAVLWAVGALAYAVGCTAQGCSGAILGGVAMGVAIAQWAAHLQAGRRARRAAHWAPIVWAPISAAYAQAHLTRLAHAQTAGGAQ